MRDLHVHTENSCDSEADMELYVKKAIDLNFETICFTDHVDLNKNDYGYDYYNSENFFEKYNKIKGEYGNNIDLCACIEFGEPHLYVNELEELSKKPYDFIIGSIHWIGNMFPCQKVREQYTAKEFYNLYWEEVLKTVKQGGFDSLGHMDFPKRYYGEIYYTETILNEIFKNLLDKNMIIEINTSSLRKGHVETMPGIDLLEIYKTSGGQYITIGSDAHVVEDLCADYQIAKSLVEKVGLREVIYKNRKQILI